jgi:hypothetical protein
MGGKPFEALFSLSFHAVHKVIRSILGWHAFVCN